MLRPGYQPPKYSYLGCSWALYTALMELQVTWNFRRRFVGAWGIGSRALVEGIYPRKFLLQEYRHPEADGICAMHGIYYGSFNDSILSTPGWLYPQKGSPMYRNSQMARRRPPISTQNSNPTSTYEVRSLVFQEWLSKELLLEGL